MAKKTFLDSKSYYENLLAHRDSIGLKNPLFWEEFSRRNSQFLLGELEKSLDKQIPEECQFYYFGSYADYSATLYSDFDLLILGSKTEAEKWLGSQEYSQIKFSIRQAESFDELSKDLDLIGIGSMFKIKSLFDDDDDSFFQLKAYTRELLSKEKSKIHSEMIKDNQIRELRYSSISNYLEPNLKFQAGGIRDVDQVILLVSLFYEGKDRKDLIARLLRSKAILSSIRQVLHCFHDSDVLLGQYQKEIANFFGYESLRDFMSNVESVCEDNDFYSNWSMEEGSFNTFDSFDFSSMVPRQLLNKSIQKLFRENVVEGGVEGSALLKHTQNQFCRWVFSGNHEQLNSLYNSKWLDWMIPDFKRVRGLVQHDQYHQFTVDQHLIQVIQAVELLRNAEGVFSAATALCQELTDEDFLILREAAFFHDLGKGFHEDHSLVGLELVDKYANKLMIAGSRREWIRFLVKNHLIYTKYAFRKNLDDETIREELNSLNHSWRQKKLLIAFSMIDIFGTNPEALNIWKVSLLMKLKDLLASEDTTTEFKQSGNQLANVLPKHLMEQLDISIVNGFSVDKIEDAFSNDRIESDNYLLSYVPHLKDKNLGLLVFKSRFNYLGLFNDLVSSISGLGVKIHVVSVTGGENSALDFFLIDAPRNTGIFQSFKLVKSDANYESLIFKPKLFVESMEDGEFLLRFNYKHDNSIYLKILFMLVRYKCDIRWHRKNLWGRQAELVFQVDAQANDILALEKEF
ncbi:MAG: HD domain-containing protein [Bdellovibrionales bacterium]